jgi:sugar fermentation stimulation protein A
MIFENELIAGVLIKRYKRFFIDIKVKNKVITAHCPNTGSMMGLLKKGNKVWFTKIDDPNRKLKYTLQIIEVNGKKIGINTHLTNKIFYEALLNRKIININKTDILFKEKKFNKNTRFDFFIKNKVKGIFIEVKNVTLSRSKGIAEFPDAVTERGLKHIKELLEAKNKGYDIYLAFVIQREDCKKFKIAEDIDPNYKKLLTFALKNKLKVICYDCKFSSKGIIINDKIKFIR